MLTASGTKSTSSDEDSSGSEAEVSRDPATDRFGFLVAHRPTDEGLGPHPQLVRQREAKWINIINQWEVVSMKKSNKVKVQCQKGIPSSLRAKCWPLLCGAAERMKLNKHVYKTLDSTAALQHWVDVIERDLDRQFPFHEMFLSRDGHGQRGLFRVLKAFTQFQPDEGYCQAQGPVAAVLLMNMPEEETFWCLVQISEQYLPGYYSPLLEGVLFDAGLLTWLIKRTCPPAYKHLQHHGVEPLMFATDWLMCLFTRHLPFNTLLRVWDLFFCHGVRVLLQVGAVLVRHVLGRAEQRKQCQGQMETLERLRAVKEAVKVEDETFIAEVCSVPLSTSDLEKQTEKELEKWRKERPSSTFDPRGRCHGYRAAWARAADGKEEQDRRRQELGNLSSSSSSSSVTLVRSASTLSLSSPSLLERWRSGRAREGGSRGGKTLMRNFSVGAKDERSSWKILKFKKVQRVLEEDDVADGQKMKLQRIESQEEESVSGSKPANHSSGKQEAGLEPTTRQKETNPAVMSEEDAADLETGSGSSKNTAPVNHEEESHPQPPSQEEVQKKVSPDLQDGPEPDDIATKSDHVINGSESDRNECEEEPREPELLGSQVEPREMDGSPELLGRQVEPRTMDASVSPEIVGSQVESREIDGPPKLLGSQVEPRTMDASVSPEIVGSQVEPREMDGSPEHLGSQVEPREMDGTPELLGSQVEPREMDGSPEHLGSQVEPREIDGPPELLGSQVEPREMDGSPELLVSQVEPREIDGSPKRLGSQVEPREMDGPPKRLGSQVEPRTMDASVSPEIVGSQVEPREMDGSPQLLVSQVEPREIDGSPELLGSQVEPREIDGSPELLGSQVEPREMDGSPELLGSQVEPREIDGSVSPELLGSQVEPRTMDGSVSPELLVSQVEPRTMDGSVSPEILGSQVEPREDPSDADVESSDTRKEHGSNTEHKGRSCGSTGDICLGKSGEIPQIHEEPLVNPQGNQSIEVAGLQPATSEPQKDPRTWSPLHTGLLHRLKGEKKKKLKIPKITVQDFSDVDLKEDEGKNRRRRKRESERRRKEEKKKEKKETRKQQKKEGQKEKEKEKESTEAFTGSQSLKHSASYAELYF